MDTTGKGSDSYHANFQKLRQVYVVLRVDNWTSLDTPLASRIVVGKIFRRHDEAEREVEKLNASAEPGKLHVWQVGRLTPDDGPADPPPEDDLERVRAERDSLRAQLAALIAKK